jgi:predicted acylesterase/phospholipase RssA
VSDARAHDPFRREVRLALVLNGGVSLAVWMGGVTHEIDLLRRASRVAAGATEQDVGGVADHDRAVFDAWVDLCRRAEVGEVVVDVIAGTSAGGLNGTLLATAVARGIPLDPPGDRPGPRLRTVWDERARLEAGRLLRDPDEEVQPSVLDGDFFQTAVGEEIGSMTPAVGSGGRPMTLFITATALGPSNRPYVDSFAQSFDVADHRRLYCFRRTDDGVTYRAGTGDVDSSWWEPTLIDDFSGVDAEQALVTAARASASFPLAFTPVREGSELAGRRIRPPATVEVDGDRWLVDGGVLDNAPFQPVLDAITRRPATGPVQRLLVYVVPSRGEATTGLDEAAPEPGAGAAATSRHPDWRAILGASVGFPREGDVRSDMEDMADLLAQADGQQAGPEALLRAELDTPTGTADGLLDQYRRARALGGLLDVRTVLAAANEGRGVVLAPASPVDLDRLVAQDLPWVPPAGTGLQPGAGGWAWGLGTAERVCRLLARDLRDRAAVGAPVDRSRLEDLSAALARVEAVRDAVSGRLVEEAEHAPPGDVECAAWAHRHIDALRVPAALAHCVQGAAAGYAAALGGERTSPEVIRAALAVEVVSQAFSAYRPFQRTAPFRLLRLGPDVDSPFVDADPQSAAEARRNGDRKLYGTRVMHFAAFGLPEWRAWDWTAGRLDAQAHLARALLHHEESTRSWLTAVQTRTVDTELGLAPDRWAAERERLHQVDDRTLIGDLRSRPVGETLALAVVDALMRALPHELALHDRGRLANTLLARKPARRLPPLWAPAVRIPARRLWVAWTRKLGTRTSGAVR